MPGAESLVTAEVEVLKTGPDELETGVGWLCGDCSIGQSVSRSSSIMDKKNKLTLQSICYLFWRELLRKLVSAFDFAHFHRVPRFLCDLYTGKSREAEGVVVHLLEVRLGNAISSGFLSFVRVRNAYLDGPLFSVVSFELEL